MILPQWHALAIILPMISCQIARDKLARDVLKGCVNDERLLPLTLARIAGMEMAHVYVALRKAFGAGKVLGGILQHHHDPLYLDPLVRHAAFRDDEEMVEAIRSYLAGIQHAQLEGGAIIRAIAEIDAAVNTSALLADTQLQRAFISKVYPVKAEGPDVPQPK